jgi:hypothetical protein
MMVLRIVQRRETHVRGSIEDQTAAWVVAKNASRNDGPQITEQNLIKSV